MKDIDLDALFCEVLSGLAAGLVVLAFWDWCRPADTAGAVAWLLEKGSLSVLTLALLIAYLTGLIVDAFGLLVDEFAVGRIRWFETATASESASFWAKVSEHVLMYRKEQWTYYSSYRNLLMLLCVGLVPGLRAALHYWGGGGLVLGLWTAAALCTALAHSMKTTLRLYNSIRQSFS